MKKHFKAAGTVAVALACLLSTTPGLLSVGAAETPVAPANNVVKLVDDYSGSTAAIGKAGYNGEYNHVRKGDWTIEDGQAKLMLKSSAEGVSTGSPEDVLTADLGDTTGASFVMIHVKWTGTSPLKLDDIGIDADRYSTEWKAKATARTGYNAGWSWGVDMNSAPVDDSGASGYARVGHYRTKGNQWKLEDGEWKVFKEADNSTIIPAGFDGYIRTYVDENMRNTDTSGLFLRLMPGASDFSGGSLYLDDLLLIKESTVTDDTYTETLSDYITGASEEVPSKTFVKMLNDFETSFQREQLWTPEYAGLTAGTQTWLYAENGALGKSMVQSLIGDPSNSYQKIQIKTKLGDTTEADYFLVYIRWTGSKPVKMFALADASQTYNGYLEHMTALGYPQGDIDFYTPRVNQGVVDFYGLQCPSYKILKDGEWEELPTEHLDNTDYAEIPAGYEGYIACALPEIAKAEDCWGVGLQLFNAEKSADFSGNFFIDNLMLAKKADAADDVFTQEFAGTLAGAAAPDATQFKDNSEEEEDNSSSETSSATSSPDDTSSADTSSIDSSSEAESTSSIGQVDEPEKTGYIFLLPAAILLFFGAGAVIMLARKKANE